VAVSYTYICVFTLDQDIGKIYLVEFQPSLCHSLFLLQSYYITPSAAATRFSSALFKAQTKNDGSTTPTGIALHEAGLGTPNRNAPDRDICSSDMSASLGFRAYKTNNHSSAYETRDQILGCSPVKQERHLRHVTINFTYI
jgi:hypothetical protein